MKTSPPKSPPETDEQKLDSPLSNRAFFLGLSYLVNTIASIHRQKLEHTDDPNVLGYNTLCDTYLHALEIVDIFSRGCDRDTDSECEAFNKTFATK